MSHTPGPWKAVSTNMRSVVQTPNGRWIAAEIHGHSPESRIDNARLIAAAPDLLAALRELLNMHAMDGLQAGILYRDNTGAMDKARSAIARAEGK